MVARDDCLSANVRIFSLTYTFTHTPHSPNTNSACLFAIVSMHHKPEHANVFRETSVRTKCNRDNSNKNNNNILSK